jgi:hypothetical protein
MVTFLKAQSQQTFGNRICLLPVLLVGPADIEFIAKFRITGINNRFLGRKLVRTTI